MYSFFTYLQQQMRDMEEEERESYLTSEKTYPYGLFNLVSQPTFFNFSQAKRMKAIHHALEGQCALNTTHYDPQKELVYFYNSGRIYHKRDLRKMQVIAARSRKSISLTCDNDLREFWRWAGEVPWAGGNARNARENIKRVKGIKT